jgi:predicted O-linked N-acetylglucosamine transferase (SPINDLY family)
MWNPVLAACNLTVEADRKHYLSAMNNMGRLLEIMKRYPEAEAMLARSLKTDPKQPSVITHWVHLRQKQCKWPVYDSSSGLSVNNMIGGTSALAMLSATDDPALQLATSERYVESKVLHDVRYLTDRRRYGHERIRIGYISSDFNSHAVSILTAELYGLHDRSQFEVFGFCWTKEDGSPLRQRVIAGMDHHIRIHALSDEEAALLIRSHEIDVLVDLHGLTLGARHNILSYRPAPVQITWLGFPGPTGLTEIDYVVADPFVLPPELEPYFTEKPLHLPGGCFQINDRQRQIGVVQPRSAYRLPEDKFVFCCFNNNFKFTPEVFEAWMRILKRTPDSILWLVGDSEEVRANLRREATQRGVDPERIIFAERVPPADYLARFQAADLFLDTYPFGAGTTASDALWAGLPLLTCAGRVFASRMAGSLLRAVNLPELVTFNLQEYENRAVELAATPERVRAMKAMLQEQRMELPLFDSPAVVRGFEQRVRELVEALPAPPVRPSSKADLSYLEAPGTPSDIVVPHPARDRRYVIVAPPFQHNSAGIRVLYDLQKWLVRAGLDAIVCTWFESYPVDQFEDDIVIYPEVAPGNLLKAKRVVRYILNVPGKLGRGEKTYAKDELLIAYNRELAPYANGRMLQVPSIEPFFCTDDTPRTIDAYFVGKGRDLGRHPGDAVAITKAFPATRRAMADFLRSVKTLYMYDDFSMISEEARLCGAEVKLIDKDGELRPYPQYDYPTLEQFKAQLHDFIELTRKL